MTNLNIIVAYDNKVPNLGDYFNDCKNDIQGFFDEQGIKAHFWDSRKCNQVHIDLQIPYFHHQPFIFIAYSHGSKEALVENEVNAYVKVNMNVGLFKNSLFISNACKIGEILGKTLIEKGALSFIGFDTEAAIIRGYEQIFIECDNYFLKLFFVQEISIKEALISLIRHYLRLIDKYESDFEKIDIRLALISLKESLVRLYNQTSALHTKTHFYY